MKIKRNIPKTLLIACYFVVLTIALFFDKTYLAYAMPITLVVLLINYYYKRKNINTFFVLSILSLMVCDYLIQTSMIGNFKMICIMTAVYFILTCLALKDYLSQIKLEWNNLIYLSLLISLGLIIYLVVAISDLVIHLILGSIPHIVLAIAPLLFYVAVSYCIYISDNYQSGFILLFAASLAILVISINCINEMFYPSRFFTVLSTTASLWRIYVLMKFFKETEPISSPLPEVTRYV